MPSDAASWPLLRPSNLAQHYIHIEGGNRAGPLWLSGFPRSASWRGVDSGPEHNVRPPATISNEMRYRSEAEDSQLSDRLVGTCNVGAENAEMDAAPSAIAIGKKGEKFVRDMLETRNFSQTRQIVKVQSGKLSTMEMK